MMNKAIAIRDILWITLLTVAVIGFFYAPQSILPYLLPKAAYEASESFFQTSAWHTLGVYVEFLLVGIFACFRYGLCSRLIGLLKRLFCQVYHFYGLSNRYRVCFVLLSAVFLLTGTMLVFMIPVNEDEAATKLYFVDRGVLVSWLYYPAPNNHILYSMVMAFVVKCLNSIYVMRWCNVVIMWGVLVTCFQIARRYVDAFFAVMSVCMLAFHFQLMWYAVHARGYALYVLLAVVFYFLLLKPKRQYNQWIIAGIVGALGLCVIPSFLYVYVSAVLAYIFSFSLKVKEHRRFLFYAIGLSAVITTVFYVPPVLVNGISAFTSNGWTAIQGFTMSVYTDFIHELGDWLFLTPYGKWLFIPFAGLVIYLNIPFRVKVALIIPLAVVLMIPFIHGVYPFSRVFIYLTPIIIGGCCCMLYRMRRKVRNSFAVLMLLLIMITSGHALLVLFQQGFGPYHYHQPLAAFLTGEGIRLDNINENNYYTMLRYHHGKTLFQKGSGYELSAHRRKHLVLNKGEVYIDPYVVVREKKYEE